MTVPLSASALSFNVWEVLANYYLLRDYCIDFPDAGATEEDLRQWHESGDQPEDAAREYAEEYDFNTPDPISAPSIRASADRWLAAKMQSMTPQEQAELEAAK